MGVTATIDLVGQLLAAAGKDGAAERTKTEKISDQENAWTEEVGLLFRSSESWTKGGRRQESEGPLLDERAAGG